MESVVQHFLLGVRLRHAVFHPPAGCCETSPVLPMQAMQVSVRRDGRNRPSDAFRVYWTNQLFRERDRESMDGHPQFHGIGIRSLGFLVQLDHVGDPDALQVCPAIRIWLSAAVDRIGHLTEIRDAIVEWNRLTGTQEKSDHEQSRHGTRDGYGVWVHASLFAGGGRDSWFLPHHESDVGSLSQSQV